MTDLDRLIFIHKIRLTNSKYLNCFTFSLFLLLFLLGFSSFYNLFVIGCGIEYNSSPPTYESLLLSTTDCGNKILWKKQNKCNVLYISFGSVCSRQQRETTTSTVQYSNTHSWNMDARGKQQNIGIYTQRGRVSSTHEYKRVSESARDYARLFRPRVKQQFTRMLCGYVLFLCTRAL